MRIITTVLCVFLASSVIADELENQKELNPYFARLNIVRSDVTIEHYEQSSDGDFEALNRDINMTENSLDFAFGREFLMDLPISFSVFAIARINFSSEGKEDTGSSGSLSYNESLQGYGGGAGGSLNFNFYINNTRTQFYFSQQSIKQKNKYFLRYSDEDLDERSTEIESIEESTVILSGFGMRILDLYNGYTFSIAVHHVDHTSDSFDFDASQGANNGYPLTKKPDFTRGNTAYSIGFGGTF